ncbi:unnamed protein product [Lota lota]
MRLGGRARGASDSSVTPALLQGASMLEVTWEQPAGVSLPYMHIRLSRTNIYLEVDLTALHPSGSHHR